MGLFELNKQLTVVLQNGILFNQINKLTIKIYSNLSLTKIHYYLKLRIPIIHRQFLRKLSPNPEYIQTHCNDRRDPFHFACRKWYLYNNQQCCYSITTPFQIRIVGIIIRILVQIRILK